MEVGRERGGKAAREREVAEGVAEPVGKLMRTVGSPSPSNVAFAAGPGVPNAACSLVSAACIEFQRACFPRRRF